MTFQINTAGIPVTDSFWYRMALLDVRMALLNSTTPENADAFEQVFEGLTGAWDELFKQQQQARQKEPQTV